jgi:proline iminopeptidase
MYTQINGNNTYYEVQGQEGGKAIIFIHGGPGLMDCRTDIKAFSSLGDKYKLIFLDLRGSGRSESNPPFTHEQWTADIEELRQCLNLDKVIIHGGYYGGFIALEYALRYPHNLSHLILRDTSSNNSHYKRLLEKVSKIELPLITEQMLERLFAGKVSSNEELKRMVAGILPIFTVNYDNEKIKLYLDSLTYNYLTHNYAHHENMPKFNITNKLNKIKGPVLVTVGRHDLLTPISFSEEIANEIETSTIKIFEKSGHSPHLEENEKYIKSMREFIQ